MNYSVTKNPIPLIWLDSNMIIALGKVRANKDTAPNVVALHYTLKHKTQEGKAIVVEHGQRDEISPGGSAEAARAVLSTLSLGVSTHHHHVQQRQDSIGARAFVDNKSSIILGVADFFARDPNKVAAESQGMPFFISVKMPRSEAFKQADKNSRVTMSALLNRTRASNLNTKNISKQSVYRQHVDNERKAVPRMLDKALNYLVASDNNSAPFSSEEYGRNYDIYAAFHLPWQLAGAPGDPKKLLDFYGSPYYWGLPFHDVWIDLYSRRLTGVNGGGEIKQSDIKDIANIASMLPICNVIVLDRAMATLVGQSGLADKYSTLVFSNKNIDELLAYIESL